VQPDKISVKVGIEVAVESGQLTALIVKGSGKANLEITMEWGK
jgi:Trypsin-co-occurring domain 1